MEPFTGEIRLFSIANYVPQYWKECDGSLLPVAEYQALFNIIGITYGGDGVNTFAVPDLRGRAILGSSKQVPLGAVSGASAHTLTSSEMPYHHHDVNVYVSPDDTKLTSTPAPNAFLSRYDVKNSGNVAEHFVEPSVPLDVKLSYHTIGTEGGSQPHENRQPFLALRYAIALFGIYPEKS
ncbi:phage tail protein [Ancylobacter sp. IITR112]|uniref:phage tail protein n=1 Tax=Ancylobacter sp. IITR112 TaxID=3138073 RepID=UPI00352A2BA9